MGTISPSPSAWPPAPSPLPTRGGWDGLNAWYDRVPRTTIVVGRRTVPAFRSMGILGYHIAFVASLLTAIRNDLSLVTTVGLSATAALSFFAWGLLRRAVTGAERLVLLEHVWVAIAAVAGYLHLAGGPVLAGLDALTVGLASFLAFGRIGCFAVGCCHGTPAATGVRYGGTHDHLPPWLIDRRLRPVPLYEAIGLLLIAAIGFALAGGRPGATTVWFLASYGVLRFGTEALRGDRRPHLGAVSVGRIMSIAQLVAAVWLWHYATTGETDAGLVHGGDGPTTVIARLAPIIVTMIAGAVLVRHRTSRLNPLTADDHLGECWRLIIDAATGDRWTSTSPAKSSLEPVITTTSRGLNIGVSPIGPCQAHVSFHHVDLDTTELAHLLGSDDVVSHNGLSHVIVDTPTARWWTAPAADEAEVEEITIERRHTDGYFTHTIG